MATPFSTYLNGLLQDQASKNQISKVVVVWDNAKAPKSVSTNNENTSLRLVQTKFGGRKNTFTDYLESRWDTTGKAGIATSFPSVPKRRIAVRPSKQVAPQRSRSLDLPSSLKNFPYLQDSLLEFHDNTACAIVNDVVNSTSVVDRSSRTLSPHVYNDKLHLERLREQCRSLNLVF